MSEQLLGMCVGLAERAGALAAAGRDRAEAEVSTKTSPTDVVTAMDRAVERYLLDELRATRPDDAVLGEEGGERAGGSGVRWVVDPIDGTVNYLYRLGHYAVSVAAERDGVVVAGAVCDPTAGETFGARLGGGSWVARDGGPRRPLAASGCTELGQALVGTGFSYSATLRARQAEVVAGLLPRVRDIRRIGAASLDLCYAAAGRLDAYYERSLSPWDFAAGALIAAEAGMVLTGLHGRPPGTDLLVAAAPGVAPALFALLESLRAGE